MPLVNITARPELSDAVKNLKVLPAPSNVMLQFNEVPLDVIVFVPEEPLNVVTLAVPVTVIPELRVKFP